MLGLIVLVAGAVLIGQIAEAEDRSQPLWLLGTLAAGYGLAHLGFGLLFGAGLAIVGLFGLMFLLNVLRG